MRRVVNSEIHTVAVIGSPMIMVNGFPCPVISIIGINNFYIRGIGIAYLVCNGTYGAY
jgi:hypothetical protein